MHMYAKDESAPAARDKICELTSLGSLRKHFLVSVYGVIIAANY